MVQSLIDNINGYVNIVTHSAKGLLRTWIWSSSVIDVYKPLTFDKHRELGAVTADLVLGRDLVAPGVGLGHIADLDSGEGRGHLYAGAGIGGQLGVAVVPAKGGSWFPADVSLQDQRCTTLHVLVTLVTGLHLNLGGTWRNIKIMN